MKGPVVSLALCALASAAPSLYRRQSASSNDLMDGNCQPISFIFARGSTEDGNLGTIVGGPLCDLMKDQTNGGVACQGVGGAYAATLEANNLPRGTDQGSIDEAVKTIRTGISNCPDAKVIAGGYSQGSAVMLSAIQALDDDERDMVKAVVFYGYTMNEQQNGKLPGYSSKQLKVFCRDDDGVCDGALDVTPGHLAYSEDGTVPQGAKFLLNMASKSGSSGSNNNGGSNADGSNNNGGSIANGSNNNGGSNADGSNNDGSKNGGSDSPKPNGNKPFDGGLASALGLSSAPTAASKPKPFGGLASAAATPKPKPAASKPKPAASKPKPAASKPKPAAKPKPDVGGDDAGGSDSGKLGKLFGLKKADKKEH